MLIRAHQMNRFASLGIERFVEQMTVHVRQCWPEECAALGDGVTERVRRAVRRALDHGLTTQLDAGRFTDLVFAFEDPDFDQKAWAAEILGDRSIHPRIRANQLWDAARERLQDQEGHLEHDTATVES